MAYYILTENRHDTVQKKLAQASMKNKLAEIQQLCISDFFQGGKLCNLNIKIVIKYINEIQS